MCRWRVGRIAGAGLVVFPELFKADVDFLHPDNMHDLYYFRNLETHQIGDRGRQHVSAMAYGVGLLGDRRENVYCA